MELKNGMAVLFVRDALASRDFYAGVLGLTEVINSGDMNFVFEEGVAVWQIQEGNIIPEKLGMDKITNRSLVSRFEVCFETDDIQRDYQTLLEHNVRFLHGINEEAWGQRTVRFYDPDGHLIEIGEALPVFIRRIYGELDRDIAATAAKMFLPVETVEKYLKD